MGKTVNNPLLTGVSGRIGNLLIKQYKSGTVITLMPSYNKKRKPTPRQKIHRDTFGAAVKYAKDVRVQHIIKHGPAGRKDGQDVYHAAIKEFMVAAKEAKVTGKFNPDHGPIVVNAAAVIEIINRKVVVKSAQPEPAAKKGAVKKPVKTVKKK